MASVQRTVRKPAQNRAKETKARIIQAAFDLISKHGYDKVTLRMIAKRAGVGIGSSYYYFKDKIDILKQVVSLYGLILNREISKGLGEVFARECGLEETLSASIKMIAGVIHSHEKLHMEIVRVSMTNEKMRNYYSSNDLAAGAVLIEVILGRFDSQIKVKDRETAIFLLHKCVEGIIEYMFFYRIAHDHERILEELAKMFVFYLTTE